MADSTDDQAERPPDFRMEIQEKIAGLADANTFARAGEWITAALIAVFGKIVEWALKSGAYIGGTLARSIARGEDKSQAAFGDLAAAAISDMFGVTVDAGALNDRGNRGRRQPAADAIGDAMIRAFSGQAAGALGGELQPSDGPAKAFLSTMAQMALEGWLEGWIVEACSLGQLETFGDLDDTISHILGLGRASAAVHGPLVKHLIVTPLEWHVNKQHRPSLLSPAEAIRQRLRGRWTAEQVEEELARQGWSAERQEALVNAQRKFFSASDVRTFTIREFWTQDQGMQHLRDQGYTETDASAALRLEGLHRFEQLEATEANAIIGAYANRDIDDREFDELMRLAVQNTTERTLLTELAGFRRRVNVRHLSSAEERRLVQAGIRNAVDYRRALEREGYQPEAVAALDLELRAIVADKRADEALRAQQAADRAREEREAADARAARLAAIAADKALPSVAELRRAYVRGHLPLDRYTRAVEAAHPGIDGADLAALVAEAELDREAYLETLERRRLAELEEADASIPLGALESAVRRGVLTIDDYARELHDRGYDDPEVNILVGVLRDELEDAAAAAAKRAEAERRAAAGGVSLNAWERAVRLRVRTVDQYAAYLASIDTPELARALILDTLRAQVALDDEARAKRQAAEAAAAIRGISLERRRRAVILGIRDLAYYERALVDAHLSVEDQRLELDLAQIEIAEAAAARARRDEIAAELEARQARQAAERAAKEAAGAAPPPPTELSLSQVERAVKLGLLAPADLAAFALAKGYVPDDADLLVELATFGIPDLRDGAARRDEIRSELAAKRVSLDELERAVLRGIRTVANFADDLAGRGYGEDDTALLAQLLEERVGLDVDRLRTTIRAALEKAEDAPPLEAIDAALFDATLAPADAIAELEHAGIARDTALVYVRLVLTYGAEG